MTRPTDPGTIESFTDHLELALQIQEQWVKDRDDPALARLLRLAVTEFHPEQTIAAMASLVTVVMSGAQERTGATDTEALAVLRAAVQSCTPPQGELP